MNFLPYLFLSLVTSAAMLWGYDSVEPTAPEPQIIVQEKPVVPEGYDSLEQFVIDKTHEELEKNFSESEEEVNIGAAVQPAGLFTYKLGGSGVSSSATSFTLTSLTLPQNDYPIQDSDLSTTFHLTLEPGSTDRQEFVSCTTVGTNTGGSVTISGCTRGLSPVSPYTASSTLQFAHGGGSSVIFSNSPSFYNDIPFKGNNETITGQWTFSTFPVTPSNATSSETIGGIVELATAAEAAAGTSIGSTGARLVLPTSVASSTYATSTAPNKVIMTDATGIMDTKFLGTSTVALHATTTITGGLTVSGVASGIAALTLTQGTSNIASTTIYATTTTGTWTKPSNLKALIIEVVGGGGGGGGRGGNARGMGGGGNAGGYCREVIAAAAVGVTETVTIGAGGAGGSTTNAGSTGGNSSFGSHCTGNGGTGGPAGSGSATAGGTATGGDVNITGAIGEGGWTDAGSDSTVGSFARGGESYFGSSYGSGGNGNWATDGSAGAAGVVVITSIFY